MEVAVTDTKAHKMVGKASIEENGHSSDQERESVQSKEEDSDCETVRDSLPSKGEVLTGKVDKVERSTRVPKKLPKKQSAESISRSARASNHRHETNKLTFQLLNGSQKKTPTIIKGTSGTSPTGFGNKSRNMEVPAKPTSESSDGGDDKPNEEVKDVDILDMSPKSSHNIGTDDETVTTEENGFDEEKVHDQKIKEMEQKIERLEQELREVAALEISLYSVVPEHGSSAHKVHTPARRLSRLYNHACKHWSQEKRATVARNTVSGLVLMAKSCGNDVPRLTFWWSNTVVLREIVSQAFGNSLHRGPFVGAVEFNGSTGRRSEDKNTPLKWKGDAKGSKVKKPDFLQFVDDWQETRTFTSALEKIESWIFSRTVESVWWQTLTPHMQSSAEDMHTLKSFGRLFRHASSDQHHGSFSINLWKSAFLDAFHRLCPLRAGGHECGCLPVLARMVMEQCVARLDVAMFNAILRESGNEIPTDPVSDPISDSIVLPIPAGDLSFGSGAQLKNAVGNWSRWLTDLFGMDTDDSLKEEIAEDHRKSGDAESKSFRYLNALSDLLMLPKDMLMDRSIRKEVCPLIGLPLITRILCNFTPDEFCPDAVPGAVLETLVSECTLEQQQSEDSCISNFPCSAAPIIYFPPSPSDVAEKVADIGIQPQLGRNSSIIQRRGYTSDEELDELDSPLASIMDTIPSPTFINGKRRETIHSNGKSNRYELLREVWAA